MNKYSVIIVGAGPAGSSAAKFLAREGLSVAIIDKNKFPRDKLCGGLLTERSRKVFESIFDKHDWDKVVDYVSHGCEFYDGFLKINRVDDYTNLYFTNRYHFDNFLLQSAIDSGVKAFLGSPVVSIDEVNKEVTLKNHDKLHYDFLIGADGVNSIVSKFLFGESFNKEKTAFGLEVDIDRKNIENCSIDKPEIFFGVVQWGYGWVFPKSDKLTVGIGGLYGKNKDLNESLLRAFIKERFGNVPFGKVKGHYIPFGDFKVTPGRNSILLCGDAAGLVEPITGEGIAFAMESGKMCAISVAQSIKLRTNNAVDNYTKIYKSITTILLWSRVMRNLVFNPLFSKIFIGLLSKSDTMPRKYLDLMEGKIEYSELTKYFVRKVVSKPFAMILGK